MVQHVTGENVELTRCEFHLAPPGRSMDLMAGSSEEWRAVGLAIALDFVLNPDGDRTTGPRIGRVAGFPRFETVIDHFAHRDDRGKPETDGKIVSARIRLRSSLDTRQIHNVPRMLSGEN